MVSFVDVEFVSAGRCRRVSDACGAVRESDGVVGEL